MVYNCQPHYLNHCEPFGVSVLRGQLSLLDIYFHSTVACFTYMHVRFHVACVVCGIHAIPADVLPVNADMASAGI